jgi:hypothetical protein
MTPDNRILLFKETHTRADFWVHDGRCFPFMMCSGKKAGGIALWDFHQEAWHTMGSLNGPVYSLAALDGWLYAGKVCGCMSM